MKVHNVYKLLYVLSYTIYDCVCTLSLEYRVYYAGHKCVRVTMCSIKFNATARLQSAGDVRATLLNPRAGTLQ